MSCHNHFAKTTRGKCYCKPLAQPFVNVVPLDYWQKFSMLALIEHHQKNKASQQSEFKVISLFVKL